MSVTLTDRDTSTYVFNQSGASPDGVLYAMVGNTMASQRDMRARFTNPRGSTGTTRANLHSEMRVVDANGKVWPLKVDTTISVPVGSPFTADQIDDVLTSHNSYFATESNTLDFVQGLPRA